MPALHSYWLWIHVSVAIISGGVFHTAAVVSVLYLFREPWEREGAAGGDVFNCYGVNIFITGLHSYGGLPAK